MISDTKTLDKLYIFVYINIRPNSKGQSMNLKKILYFLSFTTTMTACCNHTGIVDKQETTEKQEFKNNKTLTECMIPHTTVAKTIITKGKDGKPRLLMLEYSAPALGLYRRQQSYNNNPFGPQKCR